MHISVETRIASFVYKEKNFQHQNSRQICNFHIATVWAVVV